VPDAILVGYPGYLDAWPARLLARRWRCPLVLDLFISLDETVIEDRELIAPGSLMARALGRLDRAACRAADLVLADTTAHARYFRDALGVPAARLAVVPVGAPDSFALAGPEPVGEATEVLYFGQYIPLHGVEHILGAAARLVHRPDIRFTLVGDGQMAASMLSQARAARLGNVRFVRGWLPEAALIERYVAPANICLGLFGAGAKAGRVVPSKVFAALAACRAVVTAETPAAREILTDGVSARLVPPADPEALAAAVLELADDPDRRRAIAAAGHALWQDRYRPEAIGAALLKALGEVVG
jgi:glycosyltransferase involved in cell wall biosynthesis